MSCTTKPVKRSRSCYRVSADSGCTNARDCESAGKSAPPHHRANSVLTVNVHTSGLDADRLPFHAEIALSHSVRSSHEYREARGCQRCQHRPGCQPSRVQVTVADGGRGFNTEMTLRTTTVQTIWAFTVCANARLLWAGSISVGSEPGKGATASVQIPLTSWESCPKDGPHCACAGQ